MTEPLVGRGVVPALGYVNLPGDGSPAECRLVGKDGMKRISQQASVKFIYPTPSIKNTQRLLHNGRGNMCFHQPN